MYGCELDYKESWVPKNCCFWTVVLEKTLESPLDCKEIQPVHPKGDQSYVFTGRTDFEAETPILWPLHAKSWLIWKDPDAGKDWGQEEKGTTEDEMVGWYHWFNGQGFGWTLGVGNGQGGLVCCGSWGRKESDMTDRLNWTELNYWNRWRQGGRRKQQSGSWGQRVQHIEDWILGNARSSVLLEDLGDNRWNETVRLEKGLGIKTLRICATERTLDFSCCLDFCPKPLWQENIQVWISVRRCG